MSETLADRLGGEAGIERIVDDFYDEVLADESLAPYFAETDTDALRDHQRAFLLAATGAAEYEGQDMRSAHADLDLTADDFARVAAHLDDALRANGVADADREAVLETVAGLEDEVLNR
ncbi:group I truncated hemoglobin [Haloarcula litorea]|uniref:group I truncated hemoglobin n=1 Tax=Haloarcula litorea TaxID=3032579 RepID=UPI0023E7E3CA|nr:group 1 truncated hemoglobin [Halomicroarcula sp. GDY20]